MSDAGGRDREVSGAIHVALNAIETRPGLRLCAWLATAVVVAACVLPFQDRTPYVDGVFYVSSLHAFYVDGDVDMTPEAERYPWLQWYTHRVGPAPGGLRTPFPIGPPLFWAPFYAAYDAFDRLTGGAGINRAEGPVIAPIYFGTTFWVTLALLLLADLLRHTGASGKERAAVALLVFGLSPLPAYVIFAPDMSHGTSFAAVTIMLWTCIHCRVESSPRSPMWILGGFTWGLVFCARLQDAMLMVVPLVLLLAPRHRDTWAESIRLCLPGLGWLALGASIGAFPQLAHWKALYGSWISFPMDGGFFSLDHFEPMAFLFSTWNGLFLSHPGLLFCLAGFILRPAPGTPGPWLGLRSFQLLMSLTVALELSSCMLMVDWWAGGSFGQRRVISLLPLFALALQAIIEWSRAHASIRFRGALLAGALGLVAFNALSLGRLFEGSVPYNPSDRNWYRSGPAYGHYEYDRYFSDLIWGNEP